MATVPTYDAPLVNPAPLPGVRQESVASPGLFSAEGDQLQRFGGSVEKSGADFLGIATNIQAKQNATDVFNAHSALANNYIAYQTEQSQRVGVDARGLTQETANWFDKQIGDQSDNLKNTVQKRAFRMQAEGLKEQGISAFSHFEATQTRAAAVNAGQSSITSMTNLAASQVGTPTQDEALGAAKMQILNNLADLKKLGGWTGERYAVETDKALTNLHLQVIQNLNRIDPSEAEDYFKFNKGEINGGMYDSIDKMIANGNFLKKAQEAADSIDYDNTPQAEAEATIRDTTEGKVQRAAILEVRQRYSEKHSLMLRDQQDAGNTAAKILANTGSLLSVPPDVMARVSGEVQLNLQARAVQIAKRELPTTEGDLYYDLRKMWRDDKENGSTNFAKLDLNKFSAHLSPSDFEEFVKLQTTPDKPPREESFGRQLQTMYNVMGWTPSQNKQQMGNFELTARRAISDAESVAGHYLNDDERQKILDRLVVDGKIQGSGWFRDTREKAYEAYGTPDQKNFVAIPSDKDYAAARDALVRKGIAKPTEQQINDTVNAAYGFKKPPAAAPVQIAPPVQAAPIRGSDATMIAPPSKAVAPLVQAGRDVNSARIITEESNTDYVTASDKYTKAIDALDSAIGNPKVTDAQRSALIANVKEKKEIVDKAYAIWKRANKQ